MGNEPGSGVIFSPGGHKPLANVIIAPPTPKIESANEAPHPDPEPPVIVPENESQ